MLRSPAPYVFFRRGKKGNQWRVKPRDPARS
jgi:hypothetical protein